MTKSAIGSPMLKARAALVLDLPDEAWFDVGLMQKDVALALDTARQLRVPLPSAAVADELLTVARAMGYERRDLAALFEVLARLAGEPVADWQPLSGASGVARGGPEVDRSLLGVAVDVGELLGVEVQALERREVLLELRDAARADQR